MTERTLLLLSIVVLVVINVAGGVAIASSDAPLADAGLDQSVEQGALVHLDGGGSTAPDGRIIEYRWRITAPDGTSVNVSDDHAETTSFRAAQRGTYEVELTVWSDADTSASDVLYVEVTSPDEDSESNLPPLEVEILGPDSVHDNESATYLADTSIDEDRIETFEWSVGGRNDTGPFTENTFDEPDSSVPVEVTVTDDRGRSSTALKEVSVVERPSAASDSSTSEPASTEVSTSTESGTETNEEVLEVTIAGDDAVVNDTTSSYRAVVTGADSEITRYVWSHSGAGTVVSEDGRLSEHYFGSTGQEELTVAVETENGTVEMGRKDVEVIPLSAVNTPDEQGEIKIESIYILGASGCNIECNFAVDVEHSHDQEVTIEWIVGNDHYATTTTSNGETSEITTILENEDIAIDQTNGQPKVPIAITARDQHGNFATEQREFEVETSYMPMINEMDGDKILNWHVDSRNVAVGEPLELGISTGTEIDGGLFFQPDYPVWFFGDGSTYVDQSEVSEISQVTHVFEASGQYTVEVFSHMQGSLVDETSLFTHSINIHVHQDEYTEYHYTVSEEGTATYESTTSPGPEWERTDVVSSSLDLANVEREYVQQTPDAPTIDFGDGWERVDTETRREQVETETQTTHRDPGEEWTLAESNVDTARVQTGWESITVGSHYLADDEWRYLGRTAETIERTETTRSASRPSGSGWTRAGRTGSRTITGYRTVTVGSRYLAHDDWSYIGATTRTTTRTETYEVCTSHANFFGYQTCVQEETRTREVTDRDVVYRYRKPVYGSIYEWERSVERTVYQYEYERPTYSRVSLDRYERPVYGDRTYDVWEKREYETTTVYEWANTETVLVDRVSLTRPDSDDVVGDIEERTYSCDDDEGELADQAC